MGQFLLSAGARGKRYALPHARVVMHQPLGGIGGYGIRHQDPGGADDYTKNKMAELNALHTGQSIERIVADSDRDRWFTAQEALEYGFVDHVVATAAMVSGGGGTET